jgi:hypothetical protein
MNLVFDKLQNILEDRPMYKYSSRYTYPDLRLAVPDLPWSAAHEEPALSDLRQASGSRFRPLS